MEKGETRLMIETVTRPPKSEVSGPPPFDQLPDYLRKTYSDVVIPANLPPKDQIQRAQALIYQGLLRFGDPYGAIGNFPVLARIVQKGQDQHLVVVELNTANRIAAGKLKTYRERLVRAEDLIKAKSPDGPRLEQGAVEVIDGIADGSLIPGTKSSKWKMPLRKPGIGERIFGVFKPQGGNSK